MLTLKVDDSQRERLEEVREDYNMVERMRGEGDR